MSKSTLSRKVSSALAVAAAGVLMVPLLSSSPAKADPRQHTNQAIGVGSDTIQEVLNKFAGESNGDYQDPLHSDAATGRIQFSSWNALAPGSPNNTITCLTPRAGANSFQRPNGSGQGRAALSRTSDLANFNVSTATGSYLASANKPTSGIVSFARSSSFAANGSGTELTYIPFGKDALTYAYYVVGGATAITDMTLAELKTVFTETTGNGTTIRGTLVIPCTIQSGSGTRGDWQGKLNGGGSPTVSTSQIDAAAGTCTATPPTTFSGQLEENKPNQLKAKADNWASTHAGQPTMFVIGMSVSNFIGQSNGVAPSNLASGVILGSADGNAPTTGSAPSMAASAAFYNSYWGRFVYTVWLTDTVGIGSTGNTGLKQLVRGPTSAVCSASSTITAFGLLELTHTGDETTDANVCGSVAVRGGLQANP